MNRLFILYIILSFATMTARADGFVKDAEPTIIEVRYDRIEITDTTDRENRQFKDEVILRVGKNKSLFCCAKRLWRDSLMAVNPALFFEMDRASFEKDPVAHSNTVSGGTYGSYIYKNYPAGRLTETNRFDMEYWKYEEEWEKPEWTLTEETKEILGYECFKATSDYRGRHWTAWFAPEIPVQDGPWKLCGLPGLILEAYDLRHDYTFKANALISNPDALTSFLVYNERRGVKTVTRDKYFNSWWKYTNSNFGSKMAAMFGKEKPVTHESDRVPHHDKEETDYPHDL